MNKSTVDMSSPFKVLALVFLGGGLAASLGGATMVPLLVTVLAVALLVRVFRSWES